MNDVGVNRDGGADLPELGGVTSAATDDQSTSFAPPVPGSAVTNPQPMPAAHEPQPARKSKRTWVIVLAVGLAAVLAVVIGSLVLRSQGGADTSTEAGSMRLATDPKQLYSIEFDESVDDVWTVVGNPDRLAMRLGVGPDSEVRVYDGDGEEVWRRTFDHVSDVVMIGDDVLVAVTRSEDEQHQLILLSGDTGDEVWSADVDRYSLLTMYDGNVFLIDNGFGFEPSAISVFDPSNGERLAHREFEFLGMTLYLLSDRGDTLTLSNGQFVVGDAETMFVVDETLQDITEPVPWKPLSPLAYMDGELVGFEDGQLIRYGSDGQVIASVDFDVDNMVWLAGVGDSNWYFQSEDSCGVVNLSGDVANVVWEADGCGAASPESVVRFGDDTPYLLLQYPREGAVLVDAVSGEEIQAVTRQITPLANGYLDFDGDGLTAYAMPEREQLYSVPVEHLSDYVSLDNGYAIVDESGDLDRITVFGPVSIR